MANIISNYFHQYANSITNFEKFHNEVINMPRPSFSELGDPIKLLKSLASYISLIDPDFFDKPTNLKEIYRKIYFNYKNGIVPTHNRNLAFEKRYLNRDESFDDLYEIEGRMYRHYMEYCLFFGILKDAGSRVKKIIDIDSINELLLTPDERLFDVFRNKLLDININKNDFIKNLNNIKLKNNADYRPARAILRYINELNRKCTDFEISVLLGRVDDLQTENEILSRAVAIGKILPAEDIQSQIKMFFGSLGWKSSDNNFYEYGDSQEPYFKFKAFLLFMRSFNLINYDGTSNLISLTDYSKELVKADIPMEVLDLQKLIGMVDDDSEDTNKLMDIILRKRTETITKAIQSDGELIVKCNQRNIRNPIIKNGKRQRSRFIAELAKIKCNYLDEITKKPTFEGKNGKNYVEAHHIIEFSTEDGPDITDNLVCLGPQNHSLIHHGSDGAVSEFYRTCQTRGVLTFDRFKSICVKYRCLTHKHVVILEHKKMISKTDAEELNLLIDEYGVDPIFLSSLTTPAGD